METKLKTGDMAPDLLGLDEQGREVRLSDYKGRRVVVYFYPKDSTPGCTNEACNLRDHYEELREKGFEVVGVSVQDAKSHQKFIDKHGLPFPLIADTDHALVEQFGVWGEKTMAGRKYMGTFRTTFVIGTDGRIERVMMPKEIKVKEHAEQLLAGLS